MKVLLAMPHVFAPKEGSLYSSQTEAKRGPKQEALLRQRSAISIGINNGIGFMHRSEKQERGQPRTLQTSDGVELKVLVFTPQTQAWRIALPEDPDLERLDPGVKD